MGTVLFKIYQYIYYLISTLLTSVYMLKMKIALKSIGSKSKIYFANIVEPYNVSIGHHVYINKNCDIITTGSMVTIGNYVMIGPNTSIFAQNHDVSDWSMPMILNNKYIKKNVVIEDDVWIGANVTILPGVRVGRGSVVGAGSVVTKSVTPYTIVAGIPARKISNRFSAKDKRKATNLNLKKFEKVDIDWYKWGVGRKVK